MGDLSRKCVFETATPELAGERRNELPLPDIAALRLRMNLRQADFARCFGFPLTTLRHWEQGTRKPAGAALVLLHVISRHPRAVLTTVRRVGIASPARLAHEMWRPAIEAPHRRKRSRAARRGGARR